MNIGRKEKEQASIDLPLSQDLMRAKSLPAETLSGVLIPPSVVAPQDDKFNKKRSDACKGKEKWTRILPENTATVKSLLLRTPREHFN